MGDIPERNGGDPGCAVVATAQDALVSMEAGGDCSI
jgi:hypothetical protein